MRRIVVALGLATGMMLYAATVRAQNVVSVAANRPALLMQTATSDADRSVAVGVAALRT